MNIHINRPSTTKIVYKLRYPYQRRLEDGSYSRLEDVLRAVGGELRRNKEVAFIEVIKVITADYYDPSFDLVCKVKNI